MRNAEARATDPETRISSRWKEMEPSQEVRVSGGCFWCVVAVSVGVALWGWYTRTDTQGPTAEWKF